MSPLVLPAIGATTATAAGLLGGLNIDEWKSLDAKEKAKKLLKCFVMGGITGIGAEGVRQGYNTVKKRALEKRSTYKKSLLSYMLKKALDETSTGGTAAPPPPSPDSSTDPNLPEEVNQKSNTIFGMPSHLLLGGGLGLAGGLTLYHFLTEQKKKKPTGYVGAGLGGLMAGVLGAGLFKGFSAKENDVKNNLFDRDAPKRKDPTAPLPTIMDHNSFVVGAQGLDLTEEQRNKIAGTDRFYVGNIKGSMSPQKIERDAIDDYKKIVPTWSDENILQHLRYLNTVANSPYADYLNTPVDTLKSIWDKKTFKEANAWLQQQQQLYNSPFSTALTADKLAKDSDLLNWASDIGDKMALKILAYHHPGTDLTRVKYPLAYALQQIDKGNITDPNEIGALTRLAGNLGAMRAYNNGIAFPMGNQLYDGDKEIFKPANEAAIVDNRRLKYQYTTPGEFKDQYLAKARKSRYLPVDASSEKLDQLLEQLRELRYSNITGEEFKNRQDELNRLIYAEIENNSGLPREYTDDTITQVKALRNAGYTFNNLIWEPYSGKFTSGEEIFAIAPIQNGLKLNAYTDKAGKQAFDLAIDPKSDYNKRPLTELGGQSWNDLTDTRWTATGIFGKTADSKGVYRDFNTDRLFVTPAPGKYIEALTKSGKISTGVTVVNDATNRATNSRVCRLSNGYTLEIDLITGKYSYHK